MTPDGDDPSRPASLRRGDLVFFLVLLTGIVAFVAAAIDRPGRVADDAVLARAVVVDRDGTLDASAALAAPAAPYRGVFNGGYVPYAHWLILTVAPLDDARVLRVVPAYLDAIDVYLVGPPGVPVAFGAIGDRRAAAPPAVASVVPNVALPPMPEGGTLLLRVRTTSSMLVAADVVARTTFERGAVRQTLLLAAYLALLLMMVVWVVFERRSREADLWRWFVAYLGFAAAFALGHLGVWPFVLPPPIAGAGDALTSLAAMLYLTVGYVFFGRLLALFEAPRWLRSASTLLAVGPLAAATAYLSGSELAALRANALLALAFAPFAFAAAVTLRSGGGAPIALARGTFTALGAVVVVQALPMLGWAPGGPLVVYSGLLVPVVGAGVVVRLLARRSQALRREARDARDRIARAEERAMGEAAARDASERFVGVLASTLRTPLSVVRLAVGAHGAPSERALDLARGAVGDMRALLQRVEAVARLEADAIEVDRRPTEVASLVATEVVRLGLDERVELDGDGEVVRIDGDVLASVLGELLDNAVRYAAPAEPVRIGWRTEEGTLRLWVASPLGPMGAIPAERAFEKYVRGERASATTGAGIGLYVVRRLARLHGGDATFDVAADEVRVEVALAC